MGVKSGPPPSHPPEQWPNRPVYFCAHPKVETKGYEAGESLPLGLPIEFESDLFQGRVFLRLKPIQSHPNDQGHAEYFDGKKRLYQLIVQGKFKEEFQLSNIMLGDFYEKPFNNVPRGFIMRIYEKFMERISPGIILKLTSDPPVILTAFGSCQTMSIDHAGQEPDISAGLVEENTSLLFGEEKFSSSSKRRKYLSRYANSSKHTVNPEHVYTIELYDHAICFGSYYQHAVGLKIDMVAILNGQPLSVAMFTRDERMMYKFPLWHERLCKDMESESQEGGTQNKRKSL